MTRPDAIWERVEGAVAGASSIDALRHHGLELIAARTWRDQGRAVPQSLRTEERLAAIRALVVPVLLRRIRDAYDGKLILMKGPEAAARYPDPALRPFCDLDFLTEDPAAAHAALQAAGFVEMGEPARYDGAHHTRPLAWPSLPLAIELHRQPNSPAWLAPPATSELMELTRPSVTGVPGLLGPVPGCHAVLLAAHGWAHEPLRRLLDLVDVRVVLESEQDRWLAGELADRWGLGRVWRTTVGAADSLLGDDRSVAALRLWARHLAQLRERTVFETHLTRWAGPVCGLPVAGKRALVDATRIFIAAACPRGNEGWMDAVRRTGLAMANAPRPQSQHDLIKEARVR